jgi:hypothetical protein
MRPRSVALGETLFNASLLLVLVGAAMTWSVARATLGSGLAIGSVIFVIAVPFLLLILAARRRSRVALWLLTAWTLFSAWSVARQVAHGSTISLVAAITLIQVALMIGCIVLLFTRESRAWFAGTLGSDAGYGA